MPRQTHTTVPRNGFNNTISYGQWELWYTDKSPYLQWNGPCDAWRKEWESIAIAYNSQSILTRFIPVQYSKAPDICAQFLYALFCFGSTAFDLWAGMILILIDCTIVLRNAMQCNAVKWRNDTSKHRVYKLMKARNSWQIQLFHYFT